MIVANLNDCARIESVHERLKELFDYVKSHDLLNAPLGRIELDGDRLFINNTEVDGNKRSEAKFEFHRQYVDVHIVLKGVETIGWKPLCKMKASQEYNQDKDFAFTDDKPTAYIALHPGEFMIIFPEDLHAPIIGRGKIRKLVAKIKL